MNYKTASIYVAFRETFELGKLARRNFLSFFMSAFLPLSLLTALKRGQIIMNYHDCVKGSPAQHRLLGKQTKNT